MTPKEKAQELILEFKKFAYYPQTDDDELFVKEINKNAKQCALLHVEQILKLELVQPIIRYGMNYVSVSGYYNEVKNEIEKL